MSKRLKQASKAPLKVVTGSDVVAERTPFTFEPGVKAILHVTSGQRLTPDEKGAAFWAKLNDVIIRDTKGASFDRR